jgi:hypothetical protein
LYPGGGSKGVDLVEVVESAEAVEAVEKVNVSLTRRVTA